MKDFLEHMVNIVKEIQEDSESEEGDQRTIALDKENGISSHNTNKGKRR